MMAALLGTGEVVRRFPHCCVRVSRPRTCVTAGLPGGAVLDVAARREPRPPGDCKQRIWTLSEENRHEDSRISGKQLLADAGVPVPRGIVCKSAAEEAAAFE